jgi:hypothetical protein
MYNNVKRCKEMLQQSPQADLPSISYTYMLGRSHFAHRLALFGTKSELVSTLDNYLTQGTCSKGAHNYFANKNSPPAYVSFMFFVFLFCRIQNKVTNIYTFLVFAHYNFILLRVDSIYVF